ncbi:MAG TPA: carboxypeptidase-like regulatory domain-containing protein, partial [Paludibacteraceae bacterium]|nr:carboxypeptidase-like regulatory domain-containing protein [Paludibacteraceae bacterium]
MKTSNIPFLQGLLVFIFLVGIFCPGWALEKKQNYQQQAQNYLEYKGKIVDRSNRDGLAFAHLSVEGTNISTVSNAEGEFLIKIPEEFKDKKLIISYIGYKNAEIPFYQLNTENIRIALEPLVIELPEINIISRDANELIKSVFEKRNVNYPNQKIFMTAFYRESIKKNRSYVSLAEAIVDILKQPYTSYLSDEAQFYKSRKSTDYKKLDTLIFKLMGGPYNSLYLDVMKYPEYLFMDDMMTNYEFTFDHVTYIDHQMIYIVDFKQQPYIKEPLYYGKLYIDAETLALQSAIFNLNLDDKERAASLFIRKKPFNARVFATKASYRIDYIKRGEKWYYNYSRIELNFKIDWKKRLFNSNYYSIIEMAITDWEPFTEEKKIKDKIKHTVILTDEALGFSDPAFWGEYNVIEPEQPIETAIKKIQKQLQKRTQN